MPRKQYSYATASKILACIKANPGWRAKDISKLVGLKRETVNSYLYSKQSGALGHKVIQDNNYGWHLKETLNNVVQTGKCSPFSTNAKQSNQNLSQSLDREATLPLNLDDAFRGGQKHFHYDGEQIAIDVPAGTRQGDKLWIPCKGRYDAYTKQRGDLYLKVKILPHEKFQLDGDNIIYRAVINAEVANHGGEIEVPTLDGQATVSIPAGIHSGQSLRLRERGWLTSGGNRGNQLIQIVVEPSQERKYSVEAVQEIFRRDDYMTLSDHDQGKLGQMLEEAEREQAKKQQLTQTQDHYFMILRAGWFWFALLLGVTLSLGTISLIQDLRLPSTLPVENNSR